MPTYSTILMETQYLPSIAFFMEALKYANLEIEACEHFQKGGYRNRCVIAGANGIQLLTIPLIKGKNQQLPIRETRIAYTENWQKIHWRSIISAYGKSPFFEFYVDDFAPIFEQRFEFLFDLNQKLLETIIESLQLPLDFSLSTSYNNQSNDTHLDFRNKMAPKNRLSDESRFRRYPQVFEAKNGFLANLSILDLLFCTGPEAIAYLE